ncbi:Hypothetical protein FKW44_012645, partial [Caligus rogercresseyi]
LLGPVAAMKVHGPVVRVGTSDAEEVDGFLFEEEEEEGIEGLEEKISMKGGETTAGKAPSMKKEEKIT